MHTLMVFEDAGYSDSKPGAIFLQSGYWSGTYIALSQVNPNLAVRVKPG